MNLLADRVDGPQGSFVVSTIRTFSGGAPESKPLGSPFSTADYADETPWPFEVMVFEASRGTGTYQELKRKRRAKGLTPRNMEGHT